MENTKHLNGYIEEKDDTFYPTCRFCGKQTLPDAPYLSQDEANEAATIRCDCFEAREYCELKANDPTNAGGEGKRNKYYRARRITKRRGQILKRRLGKWRKVLEA